jgi:hypothetical protein
VKIPPEIKRRLSVLRDNIIAHLQNLDDETTDMLYELRADGYVCEMSLEISKGATVSEDCHDSENMPSQRDLISNCGGKHMVHTCMFKPSQPCKACDYWQGFRRQAAPYMPKATTVPVTGLDNKWLEQLHIRPWNGDIPA